MRKILPFIIILIVLFGIFTPAVQVEAQAFNDCFTQTLNRNGDGNAQRAEEECLRNAQNQSKNQSQNQNSGIGCDYSSPNPKLQNLLKYIGCIISTSVIPLIFALAVAMFIWGVVQYVINSDEEAKKEKGRQFMIWGIIALAVMVSVWGLVAILGNTFGIDTHFVPQVRVNP